MNQDLFELELRIPPATARLGLTAALLCLLPLSTTSESTYFDTHYSVPSGAFSGVTVTGLDQTGALRNTVFALATGKSVFIQEGGAGVASAATLVSQPGMVVGANAAQPGGTVLHTAQGPGLASGVMMKSRASNAVQWQMYPSGGNLNFAYMGATVFSISQTNPQQYAGMCSVASYTFAAGTGNGNVNCPAGQYILGGYGVYSGVPQSGQVLCCKFQEKFP